MRSPLALSTLGAGIVAALALGGCSATADAALVGDFVVQAADSGRYSLTWEGTGESTVYAATSAGDPAASGDEVARTESDSASIEGLDPDLRWYFEVQNADGAGLVAATRQFPLEGTNNVRDLGGYFTEDGHSVRWGKAFRGDDLSGLTPDAVASLDTAGVRTIIDFRGPDEIAADGSAPVSASTETVNIPVLDPATQTLAEALTGVLRGGDPAVVEEMLGNGESQRIKDESFVSQLQQPEAMAGYSQALQLIAESPDAVVFHCTAGKDRTGMMSAFLLGILGVPDETIIEDFVLSNQYLEGHYAKTYAFLDGAGVDVDLIRPLTEQSASNIQPVLDEVHNEYGGWDAFALEVLGLDSATVEQLRSSLLV